MSPFRVLLAVITVALVLLVQEASSIQVKIPASTEECIWEDIDEDTFVEFSFQVLSGGSHDLEVKVVLLFLS